MLLLLGFGCGLVIGLAWRPQLPARGADRALPVPPAPDTRGAPAPPPPRAPEPPEATPGEAAPPEAGLEEGTGQLVLDFVTAEGYPRAWVEDRDLEGRPTREEGEEDVAREEDGSWAATGTVTFTLTPGSYVLWWQTGSGFGRRRARVRVAAGRVTRLATDDGEEAPLPPGMGRLDVTVHTPEGGVRPDVDVHLYGAQQGIDRTTDTAGRCRFEVRAGTYGIHVGSVRRTATVRAGETAALDVRHENEGDLILDPPPPGEVQVEPVHPLGSLVFRPWRTDHAVGLLFLPAGEYILRCSLGEDDFRELGTVLVEAGRTTRFAPQLPSGSLVVRFPSANADWHRVRPTVRLAAPDGGHVCVRQATYYAQEPPWMATFPCLAPGRYRLQIEAPGCEDYEEWVDVADMEVVRRVRLTPR